MWARTIQAIRNKLSGKRNPLLHDPEYAGLHALEADMRRRHLAVAAVTRAKQDRLHTLLRAAS